jgi:ribonuclease P protein component
MENGDTKPPRACLPKNEIMKRQEEFRLTLKTGSRWKGPCVLFCFQKSKERRVAFTVPKKVGKAHIRNRIRRRLREIYRRKRQEIGNFSIIFMARPTARNADYAQLSEEFENFLAQNKLEKESFSEYPFS